MIDIAIVLMYLIALPLLTIAKKRRGGGFQAFSKISNKLQGNKLILVATIFVSSIGGGTTFGISEKAFSDSIAHSYGLILAIPVDIAVAVFILPQLIKHYKSETIGDIMSCYYGNSGRYISGFSAIMVSIGLLAAQISVSGRIFEYILQVDYITGVIISYCVVILYTTIGGLQSILFANQLQFFAIIFSIPIISIFGLKQIGLNEFISNFPMEKISFTHNTSLLQTTISAALGFAMINLLPTFIQRALINKDVQITKAAIYSKSIVYFIFIICVTLNGIIAFMYNPDMKASLALPYLIDQIIPAGLQGLVIVGLLAAVMSTADSDLNIISTTLVKDFFKPLMGVKTSKNMLKIARLSNIVIGSFAIIIALQFSKVVDLVIFIAGFWAPLTLPPLVLALHGITVSNRTYIASCIAGGLSFIYWVNYQQTNTSLKAVFIGAVVNFLFLLFFYLTFNKTLQKTVATR